MQLPTYGFKDIFLKKMGIEGAPIPEQAQHYRRLFWQETLKGTYFFIVSYDPSVWFKLIAS